MTIRSEIEARKPAQTSLVRAYDRGRKVWALQCAHSERGVHRYTLTSGVRCFDWAATQAALLSQISS
jgi:hypothetical protein